METLNRSWKGTLGLRPCVLDLTTFRTTTLRQTRHHDWPCSCLFPRTFPTLWMLQRSQTSWACTPSASATGTSRPPALPAGTACTRAWTGSPTSWRTRNDPFHLFWLFVLSFYYFLLLCFNTVAAPDPGPPRPHLTSSPIPYSLSSKNIHHSLPSPSPLFSP